MTHRKCALNSYFLSVSLIAAQPVCYPVHLFVLSTTVCLGLVPIIFNSNGLTQLRVWYANFKICLLHMLDFSHVCTTAAETRTQEMILVENESYLEPFIATLAFHLLSYYTAHLP